MKGLGSFNTQKWPLKSMKTLLISSSCCPLTRSDTVSLCMVTPPWSPGPGPSSGSRSSRHSLESWEPGASGVAAALMTGGDGTDARRSDVARLRFLSVLDKMFCILLLNCRLPWACFNLSKSFLISCESGGIVIEFETSDCCAPSGLVLSSISPEPGEATLGAALEHLWVLCVTL